MEILELKKTTQIQSSVDRLNSKMEETQEIVSELEDRTIQITQYEQHGENLKKEKEERKERKRRETQSPVGLHKRSNIYFVRILKGEEKEGRPEKVLKERQAELTKCGKRHKLTNPRS